MNRNNLQISIIIPVLNEEDSIKSILLHLQSSISNKQLIKEIIVVDGGSTDRTTSIAKENGARVVSSEKGRAKQMNIGAKKASGDILYFLHVDTFPPKDYDLLIYKSITENSKSGCFTMAFNSSNLLLNFFAWFSKFNFRMCRGGDQSLFITRQLFNAIKGYNEDFVVYEDNELTSRIYQETNFTVLQEKVITSARKYEEVGIYKLQFYFGIIHLKKFFGASPEKLYHYYKKKIAI